MNKQLERDLLEGITAAIDDLPDVHVRLTDDHGRIGDHVYDRVLDVDIKHRPATLVIEAKASAFPRDIRAVADRLAHLRMQQSPQPLIPIVAAPSISETSRKLLREERIGYWDQGGSLYIDLPWGLIFIDRPAPRSETRRLQQIFRGTTTQVLHALLLAPDHPWHVQDLAARAQVSPSTAHQVFVFLEEQLWVEKQGKGPQTVRLLRNPGALLDAWAEEHSLSNYSSVRFHRWARRSRDLLESTVAAFDRVAIDYALTLTSGAHLVAPFATDTGRLTILVPAAADLDDVAHHAQLKSVEEGENVVLLQAPQATPLLFRQRVRDVWVASDIQLYLDLWAWPQRGKEQARHLRQERLSF
jgi:hypothetical protein